VARRQGQAFLGRHHGQHHGHVAAGGIAHEDDIFGVRLIEHLPVDVADHAEHGVEIMLGRDGIDRHGDAETQPFRHLGDQPPMIGGDLEDKGAAMHVEDAPALARLRRDLVDGKAIDAALGDMEPLTQQ
jgi:hypothetical protein